MSRHEQESPLLRASGLELTYGVTPALRGVELAVFPGEIVALTGKSGSGKTSLLYCLAGLISPDHGTVHYRGKLLSSLHDSELSSLRLRDFGFVFQFGELVPELTILENVMLPVRLLGEKRAPARQRACALLERLGIISELDRRPAEVSGGQAQRAAVARALIHSPRVVFADEPTGSLDSDNRKTVLMELISMAKALGSAIVIVTHESDTARFADRSLEMSDGICHSPQSES